jgi:hypothetical protein
MGEKMLSIWIGYSLGSFIVCFICKDEIERPIVTMVQTGLVLLIAYFYCK